MVVPTGSYALSIDGDFDLGGFVFKDGKPFIHNDGGVAFGNTALGLNALVSVTLGSPYSVSGRNNSAFGYGALQNNTSGIDNTANGFATLYYNTEGSRNTASGWKALAFNETGSGNTASGAWALYSNTTGINNTATGYSTLRFNTEGRFNTASGWRALRSNTTGNQNTAIGTKALYSNITGVGNTAVGNGALQFDTGNVFNTAIGFSALAYHTLGRENTALGYKAGFNATEGSHNIFIANRGVAGDASLIKIGTSGTQTKTYVAGIRGASSTYAFDEAVCTNSQDQLGPCAVSSLRFKQDVEAMGDTTEAVSALHPVTFRYRPRGGQQPEQPLQYGLIAEEVAKVFPTLVSYDDEGMPYTVRYSLLTPLLLNELQKQATEIRRLTARLDRLESTEPP
jgi:hypothetical protein